MFMLNLQCKLKTVTMMNIKTLNIMKNLLTVSNEIKHHVKNTTVKSKFTQQEYKRLYPNGSNAGKFYGTAKLHKLLTFGTVDQLP